MRTCDVAIIGLGLMGSSALHSLWGRGVDVLGFDPLIVGEARGSSHGSCRVYRRFNFESEAYTDLSDRAFHQGLTRAQWKTGNIPVPPYRREDLDVVKWRFDYSYKGRVGLQVYLQPKATSKVGGLAFNVELHEVGPPQHRRWLVDYWTPAGQQGPAPSSAAANPFGTAPKTKAGLGAVWLMLPIGLVLGLMVSVPIVLGIRGWRRRVRADRAYDALAQR